MLAFLIAVGTGCSGTGSNSGSECDLPSDCGSTGEAACVGGDCLLFDETSGHGGAVVDLSFHRDLYNIAESGYVWFILQETSQGEMVTCQDILNGAKGLRDANINRLQVNPKYLVFHWELGGTFFPNNLIQLIRPAQGVIAVAEAYRRLEGEGDLTAIGCEDGINIVKDQNANVVIPLDVPQWR